MWRVGLVVAVLASALRAAERGTHFTNFSTLLAADVVSNPTNPKNWYSLGA
jgi:hypothetical protein